MLGIVINSLEKREIVTSFLLFLTCALRPGFITPPLGGICRHYENTPIQINRNFFNPKRKIFRQKFLIFFVYCSIHRLWVLIRTASTRRF